MGFDAAAEAMQKGECALLVLAADISERTSRSIRQIAEQTSTDVLQTAFGMDAIGHAVGRKQTGIIAISDSGFAKTMKTIGTENDQEECI